MAALTSREKKNILNLKMEIGESILTLAKIQDIAPSEYELLHSALIYLLTDHVGDYPGRMAELSKLKYMVGGILYHHLDSKQIRFGDPKFLDIPLPQALNKSLGTSDLSDDWMHIAPDESV